MEIVECIVYVNMRILAEFRSSNFLVELGRHDVRLYTLTMSTSNHEYSK